MPLPQIKGHLKWKYSTSDNVESSPSVKNGVVYFGSKDSSFLAIDALTGKLIWKFPNSGPVLSHLQFQMISSILGQEINSYMPLMPIPEKCSGKIQPDRTIRIT